MALVRIHSTSDVAQAQLLQSILQGQGIAVHVSDDAMAGFGGMPGVWVGESDADRALAVIRDIDAGAASGRQEAAHEWICPKCQETIERQFTACWNCQTARPMPGTAVVEEEPADLVIGWDVECVCCGYNLRGLTPERRCPECGAKVLHTIFDGLRDGVISEDTVDLQLMLRLAFEPVAEATGTSASVLAVICHAWLIATEPLQGQRQVIQTPTDVVLRCCEIFGVLAVEEFGTSAAAGLRLARVDSPLEFASKLESLMRAGLIEPLGCDPRSVLARIPSMLRFLPQR